MQQIRCNAKTSPSHCKLLGSWHRVCTTTILHLKVLGLRQVRDSWFLPISRINVLGRRPTAQHQSGLVTLPTVALLRRCITDYCPYTHIRTNMDMYGRVFSPFPSWGTLNSFHVQFCFENWGTWKLWNCKLCRASFKAGKLNRQCVPGHQVAMKRNKLCTLENCKVQRRIARWRQCMTATKRDLGHNCPTSKPKSKAGEPRILNQKHSQHWFPGHLATLSLRVLTHQDSPSVSEGQS